MSKERHKTVPAIHITTLGCSKNVYDSEILMGHIEMGNARLTPHPEDADVIIINTCGFIAPAKQESVDAILEAEQLKKADPQKKIIVFGCLSARYAEELKKELPAVDAFFGTEDYAAILRYLNIAVEISPDFLYEKRIVSTPAHYAYLKVAEGCNHKCSFCAIPLMRGRHRSRPLSTLVNEAEMLAGKGTKELIIISQDTTFYGIDLYKRAKIVELLENLEQIPGIEWIRLHYLYPTSLPPDLIDFMAGSKKVVPYLDMPVQHITDRMLKIMKRGGNSRRIRQIFTEAREKLKNVTLRTTLIVGHPGETEADFRELKLFVEEMQFERLGVFRYSHEENTSAYRMDDLFLKIKERRYREIMALQQQIALMKNNDKIGRSEPIIVDEVNHLEKILVGRTTGDSPEIDNEVIVQNSNGTFQPGNIIKVKVLDASEYELYAQVEEN